MVSDLDAVAAPVSTHLSNGPIPHVPEEEKPAPQGTCEIQEPAALTLQEQAKAKSMAIDVQANDPKGQLNEGIAFPKLKDLKSSIQESPHVETRAPAPTEAEQGPPKGVPFS